MHTIFEILGILFVALVVVCVIILVVLIFNVRNLEITCVCGKRFGRLPNTEFNDKGTREVVTRTRHRLHRMFNCKG